MTGNDSPSKQSEAVRRHWETAWLSMTQPGFEGPDDESWGNLTAEPRGVDYLETEAGGRAAMWAVPKGAAADRVLLCVHGGGFMSGSLYTHRKMFGHLAKAAGIRALLVSYRLLPEGVFPVPADDVTNAYRWLLDQGISPRLAHCYRMLGSADEAEDVVQDTYLRAWRSYDSFESRSSVRTWLYRIATNACLTALDQRGRRALPSGLGGPAADPDAPPDGAEAGIPWLEPIPDALVIPESQDPAVIVAAREWLRLAIIASLQYLPPRQRAVLLLREVLRFPAAEVAGLLGVSTAAVKSTLQRARARLDEVAPVPERVIERDEPRARELLGHYIAGFENADVAALEKALRADAAIEMVGTRTWFSGRVACLRYLTHVIGAPGEWRMTPALANGQPAAVARYRGSDFGLGVLTVTPAGVSRITVFAGGAELAGRFSLPRG